jgi:hypothetical protein
VSSTAAARVEATSIERVFRDVYGQAVATLVRVFGDISLAEDAVQDAFVVASDRCPKVLETLTTAPRRSRRGGRAARVSSVGARSWPRAGG